MDTLVQARRLFLYRATQKVVEWLSRYRVMSGPFKGMRYPKGIVAGNALHSKYLGIYEKELHFVWDKLRDSEFSKVIDVGAAEGYYVIGSALRFPDAQILAFEAGIDGQAIIRKMAQFNNVDSRVKVAGYCYLDDLTTAISNTDERVLIIMDIEGGEFQLLDPIKIPQLRKATILVETHDFNVPNCSKIIFERFSPSHKIEVVSSCNRAHEDLPFRCPSFLSRWFIHVGSDQRCAPQDWFLMIPNSLL